MPSRPWYRRHLAFLAVCAVLATVHQLARWGWYIDDAAISFAYARNWAEGHGLVAVPGAERIEGYSNPTWVLLLALWELVGLDGFTTGKPMALAFSLLTLPVVYRLAQRALPGREDGVGPLLAPLLLACNAQFAIWSMSALENSLFGFLVALGAERVLAEIEAAREGRRAWPLSALVFLALAWTRPEGLLYAAVGGAWYGVLSLHARRGLWPVVGWVAAFWGPHLLLLGLRLWYFAWPFPNTYYAKVGVQGSYPWNWNARGWNQARQWAHRAWQGWFFPVYVFGLVGTRGWRSMAGGVALLVVGASLLVPGPSWLQAWDVWPDLSASDRWLQTRIALFAAVAVGLPLLPLGTRGGGARGLVAHLAATSLFFAVYANGDWMGAFRWMSLMAPTTAVLFAVGATELAERAGGTRWRAEGWLIVAVLVGAWLPPNVRQTLDHVEHNKNETPFMVRRRGAYTTSVARRTFHEEPVVNLEMDQGAHMWWFPAYQEVDMAGLIDIPMARHRFDQRPFIYEYVLQERQPTFAHVHGSWAKISRFRSYDAWHRRYVMLPPYPDGDLPPHDGVWARRDLFARPAGTDTTVLASFPERVDLVDVAVPATAWAAGHPAFVEVAIRSPKRKHTAPVRLVAFLAGQGQLHTWDLSLGYDGWFPQTAWRDDEAFVGRYAVTVPKGLPPGTYDLGFVVLGPDGRVWPAGGPGGSLFVDASVTVDAPRFAKGEVRLPQRIRVVATREEDGAEPSWQHTLELAAQGACAEAEAAWIRTKRHRPIDGRWHGSLAPHAHRALATCWAQRADGSSDPVHDLARAHRWDWEAPALAEAGEPVGERLWSEGMAARARGDSETAYARFRDVLSFQPWRSWARRYAEEARDERLGVSGLSERASYD